MGGSPSRCKTSYRVVDVCPRRTHGAGDGPGSVDTPDQSALRRAMTGPHVAAEMVSSFLSYDSMSCIWSTLCLPQKTPDKVSCCLRIGRLQEMTGV